MLPLFTESARFICQSYGWKRLSYFDLIHEYLILCWFSGLMELQLHLVSQPGYWQAIAYWACNYWRWASIHLLRIRNRKSFPPVTLHCNSQFIHRISKWMREKLTTKKITVSIILKSGDMVHSHYANWNQTSFNHIPSYELAHLFILLSSIVVSIGWEKPQSQNFSHWI